jgi:hypothetical protein
VTRLSPYLPLGLSLSVVFFGGAACDLSTFLPPLPTAEPMFGASLPVVATLPDFGAAWSQGPVGLGRPLTVGAVEVVANDLLRPADTLVIHADSYPAIEPTEQFAMVDVSVTCRAADGESCTVTELNFSLEADAQKTYFPEFAMSLDGLNGLFDGGQIASGETLSGDVVFVVDRDAAGLILRYSSFPGGPGPQATFTLEP